ncbi:MAG: phosphoribosyltransferase [Bacteroidetes bacterium]|nr:phosphoribosyltransferase [Bacteroidota bacterium]
MVYSSRTDAAKKLIPFLSKYRDSDGVVVALPRGGVPIGAIIAKALNLPLELLLVKKIGHPDNSELAIGAVSLDEAILEQHFDIEKNYFKTECERIRSNLKEKYLLYSAKSGISDFTGKLIILTDDGIATGYTIRLALQMLRKKNPLKVIVAVPVAPPETIQSLESTADEVICPLQPSGFISIGQFYEKFSQVSDDEVVELMKESRKLN